jgi:phage baseplate assembly protein W
MRHLAYPYHFDGRGRTAETDLARHVRDLVELTLFTSPGERVNRPDFGSGLMQLVFAGASEELAATTQFLVQGALNQWLGDLIAVEAVEVQAIDERLDVEVRYQLLATGESRVETFSQGAP